MMLNAFLLRVFENAGSKEQLENKDCRFTTAALLVRVATVNGEMSPAKRGKLNAVLKSSFRPDYLAKASWSMAPPRQSEVRSISTTSPVDSMRFSMIGGRRKIVGMM